jgi:hypothetical protein
MHVAEAHPRRLHHRRDGARRRVRRLVRRALAASMLAGAVGSAATAIGLLVYGRWFLEKMKDMDE